MGGEFPEPFAGIDSRLAGHCFSGRVEDPVAVATAKRANRRIQGRNCLADSGRCGYKQPLSPPDGPIPFLDKVGLSLADGGKGKRKDTTFPPQDRFPVADPFDKGQSAFQ